MKQCPVCSRTFSDDTLVYCLDDGSVLANAYDPGATLRMPSPRSTNPPPTEYLPLSKPSPQRSKTWLIVLLASVLLLSLVAAGTLILWFSLRDKNNGAQDSSASQTSTNQSEREATSSNNSKNNRDSSSSSTETTQTTPSWKLVGVWRTNVSELGVNEEITYTFRANGTSQAVFKDAKGRTATDHGTWQYSDGILYEKFSNGVSGKGSIEWIDNDTLVITIIDNGVPAYNGLKRRYRRIG
jgi:type II secretory pathway pseudopilin PulG